MLCKVCKEVLNRFLINVFSLTGLFSLQVCKVCLGRHFLAFKYLIVFNLFSRFSNWLPNSAKTRHTKMPLENDESSFLLSTNLKRKKPRKTPLFKKQYLPLQRPPRHVNRNIFCHLSSRHILHFGVPSFEKCKDGSCS